MCQVFVECIVRGSVKGSEIGDGQSRGRVSSSSTNNTSSARKEMEKEYKILKSFRCVLRSMIIYEITEIL